MLKPLIRVFIDGQHGPGAANKYGEILGIKLRDSTKAILDLLDSKINHTPETRRPGGRMVVVDPDPDREDSPEQRQGQRANKGKGNNLGPGGHGGNEQGERGIQLTCRTNYLN